MTYIEALNLIRSVGFFGDFSEHSSKMFYLNKNDYLKNSPIYACLMICEEKKRISIFTDIKIISNDNYYFDVIDDSKIIKLNYLKTSEKDLKTILSSYFKDINISCKNIIIKDRMKNMIKDFE